MTWQEQAPDAQSDAQSNAQLNAQPTVSTTQTAAAPKQKKKGKYADFEVAPEDAVYFLFDVETTGPKRNYDRIIAISFFAHNEDGTLRGHFSQKINPGGVRVNAYLSQNVHSKFGHIFDGDTVTHTLTLTFSPAGLTNYMLRNEPKFEVVGPKLNEWFQEQMRGKTEGVLVSHNTPVDIQYLCCEYIRCGIELSSQIRLGLDTLATLRRFSSICYRKVPAAEWSCVTSKGKTSMGIKPCATYALSKRTPPTTVAEVCGEHHDADADTRMVAVVLFDESQFGRSSLHHAVFKSKKRCFQPIEEVWEKMKAKSPG